MSRRHICLLGTHPTFCPEDIPDGDDVEVWAANEAHKLAPERISRIFQLHPRNWREDERRYLNGGTLPPGLDANCFGRNQQHVDYLRSCGVPVYMQQRYVDIPTCTVYPFDVVRDSIGVALPPHGKRRLWATSTFGYMMALLLTELSCTIDVEELWLAGIELPLGTWRERTWEWPNLAYYLGVASGRGIAIKLPQRGSSMLSAPHYALGHHPRPWQPDHWSVVGGMALVDDADGTTRLGAGWHWT